MRNALFLLLAAAVLGCQPKAPESTPDQAGSAEAVAADAGLTGTVLEKIAAPPYVYLRIQTAQGEVWAAVSEAPVETGATVTVANAMLMQAFESKSLNRTFDQIWFGTLAADGMPAGGAGDDPHAGLSRPTASVPAGRVARATGADARTVAEIWAQKDDLDGRTVTVSGMVVKSNEGVMGKNWLHLQDGSGQAGDGTNDITVTTTDRAAKGATVTVKGTVRTNRDFGAGYTYKVIIEDAKVVQPL